MSPFVNSPTSVLYTDSAASMRLTSQLRRFLTPLPPHKRIVIVCVGTDRCTGDSLGPLTGSLLVKYRSSAFDLFGTLENPVHAMNLDDTLEQIKLTVRDPFVIGIDACLGKSSSIGMIQIADGPLYPGAGVNKKLTPVGDIHISAIVNVGGMLGYHVLQNTRLHLIMGMANIISKSLIVALTLSANANQERSGSLK